MTEREKMMRTLQMYDFALYETGLYLDGHPYNKRALNYFEKQKAMRKKVADAYEQAYGPLTMLSNMDPDQWRWIDNPWPWEGED